MSALISAFIMFILAITSTAWAAPRAYIPNSGQVNDGTTVSVIDIASNAVIGAPITVGAAPVGVAVHPDGTRVYVTKFGGGANTVAVIDTGSNLVTATIVVGPAPYGIAVNPSGTRVYVANSGASDVSVIDTSNNTVIGQIVVASQPVGVTVSADGASLYVLSRSDLTVRRIDTITNTVTISAPLAGGAAGSGSTERIIVVGSKVYVSRSSANVVDVLDGVSLGLITSVPVNFGPEGLASFGTKLFVAVRGNSTVSVINTNIDQVTNSGVPAGLAPTGLSVSPDGSRLYVINTIAAGTVTVIDSATLAVIATVNVGSWPFAVGRFIADVPTVNTNVPVLIEAFAASSTTAVLGGRIEGVSNTTVALDVFSASTCAGVVPLGAPLTSVNVSTDGQGYFATSALAGINTGSFAAVRVSGGTVKSNCLVSAPDNYFWPGALLVTDATPIPGYIDAAGKSRWFKVPVTPGQQVKVTLSNLPADYDVAIFKDIRQAFLSQLAGTPTELTKLTAEFAPSAFSPSAFSPSAFSPSAFSPDAYSPSAFSPSAFSPSVYSPSAFSPSAFSPSAFSPSAFSPSAFSPSAFSPSAFSPSAFSPSAFSPLWDADEIKQAFSSAQTRSLLAVSATVGVADESVSANTWNNTGEFYVRVVGHGGAFATGAPFSVKVEKTGTSCSAVSDLTPAAGTPRTEAAGGNLQTLIVTDSSSVALDESFPLLPNSTTTLRATLMAFMARADVAGTMIDIASDPRVIELKTRAAANASCPFARNLVAREVKAMIDSYRANNPLRYIVLAGNDDAVPFYRYPDESLLGQESGYVPPVNSTSASEASLRRDFVLGQDFYGSAQQISLLSTDFPIPGLAVGRLVETPAEMAGLIQAYTAANGVSVPTSSLVTGYDFLQDAADAVSTELELGTGVTPDKLITPNGKSPQDPSSWTAADFRQKLLSASRYDLMFLAGHFSANSLLAADFTTSVITTELGTFPVNLANSIVFSAGCHSGYNLVDNDAILGVTLKLDWPQAFAQKKATLIAGTGYQYGDTDFIEYSERLYTIFARQLRAGTSGPVAVGEALMKAKKEYLASTPNIQGLHQKALLEATLFGLPMLQVNMPYGRSSPTTPSGVIAPSLVATQPARTLGLNTAPLSVSTALTTNTRVLTSLPSGAQVTARWLTGVPADLVINPGQPVLPLAKFNVTATDSNLVLRGVGFRGGNYADVNNVIPLTGAATTELRGVHTPFLSPVFFPMRLWTANYFGALATNGATTNLLVTPAQYRAYDLAQGTSTQRSFQSMDLKLYYSGLTTSMTNGKAALSAAPTIVRVDALPGSPTKFVAVVTGDPAAAIHEVWVTYTGGPGVNGNGTWTPVNLSQCVVPLLPPALLPPACGSTADSQLWMADVALPPNAKYIVQAVNGVGLVSLDDNLGSYYSVSGNAPAVATAIAFSGSIPQTAAFGSNATITAVLSAGGSPLPSKLVTVGIGANARSGTTDSTGRVTATIPILSAPGTYPITVSFTGDGGYLASAVSGSLTVTQAATTLSPLTSGVGVVALTSTIGGKTQPLMQETVRISVTGSQGNVDVYVTTDYLGRAVFPPPGFAPGTYTLNTAYFDGNATYSPSPPLALNVSTPSYDFAGFYAPVVNQPAVNVVKAGSSVAVKFSLGGNRGLQVFAAGFPASVACPGSSSSTAFQQTVNPGASSLQYDSATGQYSYIWKTDKAWTGTCRNLVLKFIDGTQRSASFQFKD